MALTYTQLKSAVQAYLEDSGTTFLANIDEMIVLAETRILYDVPSLPYFYESVSGTLTTSNSYLTMPANFMSVEAFMVTSSGTTQAVLPKEASFMREAYPTNATGLPRYYAVFDETQLIFGPTPDQNYAYEMFYFSKPASIVTASTTWLGNFADDCLLYGTLVEAYTFLKGDPDVWQGYKALYDQSIAKLKNYADSLTKRDEFRNAQIPPVPQ